MYVGASVEARRNGMIVHCDSPRTASRAQLIVLEPLVLKVVTFTFSVVSLGKGKKNYPKCRLALNRHLGGILGITWGYLGDMQNLTSGQMKYEGCGNANPLYVCY